MSHQIPQITAAAAAQMSAVAQHPKTVAALKVCADEVERAMAEQVRIAQIESPTFAEKVRGEEIKKLFEAYGLKDVVMEPSGNVVGRRPGRGGGPVLAIAAHLDTVFPAGTNLAVRQEGRVYYGPGIGDDAAGLRSVLQVIRALEAAEVETTGDILFVGTVGEEGNGDIRGSKALFDGSCKIDGFVGIDMETIDAVQHGATGSHRWRLTIEGQGGHSYIDFGIAPSAIHAMCRAGAAVADFEVPEDPKTTFTIGTIKGGTTVNSIAASATVDVDMRSVNLQELEKLEAKVLAAFEEAVARENARWPKADEAHMLRLVKEQIGDRPAGMQPDDSAAIQAALAAMTQMGIEVKKCAPSSTDANKPISIGVPSVCIGTGGVSSNVHSLKEFFEAVEIEKGPQLAILIALALVGIEGAVAPMLPKLS